MEVRVHEFPGGIVVEPRGSLDHKGCVKLNAILSDLVARVHPNLILDLSQLEAITSAGLRVIVAAFKAARLGSGDLSLVVGEGTIGEVLRHTGLDTLFQVYPSCEAALASH